MVSSTLTLPESVTAIAPYACASCTGLTTLNFSSKLKTIEHDAFTCCENLETITSLGDVANIPEYVFDNCQNLTTVTLPETLKIIGKQAFNGCNLSGMLDIPKNVQSIAYGGFGSNINLTTVKFAPESKLASIGEWCFGACGSLTTIVLPAKLKKFAGNPFNGCIALTGFSLDSANTTFSISSDGAALFDKKQTRIISYAEGNPNTSYTVPETVTTIGNGAFSCNPTLTSIILPSKLKTIEAEAFSLSVLGPEIKIPKTVTQIGNLAFNCCDNLVSLTFLGNAPKAKDEAFENWNGNPPHIYFQSTSKGFTTPYWKGCECLLAP